MLQSNASGGPMKKYWLALLAFVLSLSCMAQDSATKHMAHTDLPNCDSARVRYQSVDATPFDSKLASRIEVHDTDASIEGSGLEQSPQKTRWIRSVEPDYRKPGPYTTTIYIGTINDDPSLKLVIRQHEGISIRWLNEKLLYGSVTWGRIVSTEFIFDVEAKKFIYEEMANSGELMEPCN
jgi:hypothetical protein